MIWFTGYDWYRPLTDAETAALANYMASGGRLFFSSQDALYYQAGSRLSREYLGVLAHSEDVTPTVAYGADGRLGLSGAMALDYPFQNFSDGLIPAPGASVELYGDVGWALGVTHADDDWKSAFLAFPFETLPAAARPEVMEGIVGWLSWLGESDFSASERVVPAGGTVVLSATLRNDGPEAVTAVFSNPLPAELDLMTDTLLGGDLEAGVMSWRGTLAPGGEHLVRYAGTVLETLTSTATISYEEHDLAFHRALQVWVDAPDLTRSLITVDPSMHSLVPGWPVTYSLHIRNAGLGEASQATAVWTLPANLTLLTNTLRASGGEVSMGGRVVHWVGSVAAGETISVQWGGLTLAALQPGWLSSAAVLDDGVTEVLVRGHALALRPVTVYFPVLMQ